MGRCIGCCLSDSSAIWKLGLCHLLWLQTQKTAPQRGENVWKLVFCPLTTVSRLTFYSFPPGLFCIVRKKLMCLCSERSSVQLLLWIEWHAKSRISYAVCSLLLIPTHKLWNLKARTLVLSYTQTEAWSKLWLIVSHSILESYPKPQARYHPNLIWTFWGMLVIKHTNWCGSRMFDN